MPSIGTVTLIDFVRIEFPKLGERVDSFVRDGIEGQGFQLGGKNEARARAVVVHFADKTNILKLHDDIKALQGQIVQIVNDLAVTHDFCLIERVGGMRLTAAKTHDADPLKDGFRGEIDLAIVITKDMP